MPSNIETSGVIHRLQEGRMPSNIETSCVRHRLQEGRVPSYHGGRPLPMTNRKGSADIFR